MAKLNAFLKTENVRILAIFENVAKKNNDCAILLISHFLLSNDLSNFDDFSIFAGNNIDFMLTLMVSLLIRKPSFQYILTYRSRYSRNDQVIYVEDCLPQILIGPFLNT